MNAKDSHLREFFLAAQAAHIKAIKDNEAELNQLRSDAMVMALRLNGSALTPEIYDVMDRWRPKVEKYLNDIRTGNSPHTPIVDKMMEQFNSIDSGE